MSTAITRHADNPATPRSADSVVLIRDGDHGVDAWMMHRVSGIAFAPGAMVFPGGRVDPSDADDSVSWTGTSPESLATRMGTDPTLARSLITAAVRELFEETGILFADPLPAVDLREARASVEARALSLAQLFGDNHSTLRAGLLHPWARWVTPPAEPRRYDTWFFLAALPEGIDAAAVSQEADSASWINVDELIQSHARGESHLLPPTLANLTALSAAGSVSAAMAEAPFRRMEPVHPEIRVMEDGQIDVTAEGITYTVRVAPD